MLVKIGKTGQRSSFNYSFKKTGQYLSKYNGHLPKTKSNKLHVAPTMQSGRDGAHQLG